METMKREEPGSLTRRHFKRLCRVILDEDETSESGKKATRFGRFLLKSELGRGSFGVVWRAHDPTMDRDVALKILPPASRDQDHDRLLREVRAAARLKHPGVVSVYEMGEVEGRPFIVMDLVEGEPLGLPVKFKKRKLLEIMIRLAETLQYAHGKGLVHRDIKPSNILIGKNGLPVLVDFGLARTIGRDDRVTMTGAIFGTPAYMSPEQAGGTPGEVDARSDLYSLGVVLYELLGGRLPHEGNTPYEITQAILNDDPPRLTSLNPKIPPELEAITFMAMSRSRDARYASAGEFAEDLRAFLKGKSVRARPVSSFRRFFRRLRHRPWIPVSAVASIVLVSLGIWVGTQFGGETPPAPTPGKVPPVGPDGLRQFTFLPDLHESVRSALEGRNGPDRSGLRARIEAEVAASPKALVPYVSLAQLDLLEGNSARALARFDQARKAGTPPAETLSSKCAFVLLTGGPFLFQETPGKIVPAGNAELNSLLDGLRKLGSSPFLKNLEIILSGKIDGERRGRPKPPEGNGRGIRQAPPDMSLLQAIEAFNSRRYPEMIGQLQPLRREYPTPAFGALLALAQLVMGRLDDVRRTLEEFSRLPIEPGVDFIYLRALVALEEERWEDCERELANLPDSPPRKYTEGLLLLAKGDKVSAAPVFDSCGDFYPARWQVACLQVRRDPLRAMKTLEEVVAAAGRLEFQGRPGKPARSLKSIRPALPWFILDREVLERVPVLRPLREDARTRDRFLKLLGR